MDTERYDIAVKDFRRWFFDALTREDTPLTLLMEWLTGESIDLINRVAARMVTKPYIPICSGYASEWVCAVASLVSGDDSASVIAMHTQRLPYKKDLNKVDRGVMIRERPAHVAEAESPYLRVPADFAPRTIAEVNKIFLRTEVDAEVSVVTKLRASIGQLANRLAIVSSTWLHALWMRYEGIVALQTSDQNQDIHQAIQIAMSTLKDATQIEACVVLFDDVLTQHRSMSTNWMASDIGIRFLDRTWSMMSALPEDDKAFVHRITDAISTTVALDEYTPPRRRRRVVRGTTGSVSDVQTKQYSSDDAENRSVCCTKEALCRSRIVGRQKICSLRQVRRFVDEIESIPGLARLIETRWHCDLCNIRTVTSPAFCDLVLVQKRQTRLKQMTGRTLQLPVHEYMQVITAALGGQRHMYGNVGGLWIDDYHPTNNPDGCPPWILAAIVIMTSIASIRHVFMHARALRKVISAMFVETNSNDSSRRTVHRYIFSIAGERLRLPCKFLLAAKQLISGNVSTTSALRFAQSRESAQNIISATDSSIDGPKWKDLTAERRDDVILSVLMNHVSGMATFGRFFERTLSGTFPAPIVDFVSLVCGYLATIPPTISQIKEFLADETRSSLLHWFARQSNATIDTLPVTTGVVSPSGTPPIAVSPIAAPSNSAIVTFPVPVPIPIIATSPPLDKLQFLARAKAEGRMSYEGFARFVEERLFEEPGVTQSVVETLTTRAMTEFIVMVDPNVMIILYGITMLPRHSMDKVLVALTTERGRQECVSGRLFDQTEQIQDRVPVQSIIDAVRTKFRL